MDALGDAVFAIGESVVPTGEGAATPGCGVDTLPVGHPGKNNVSQVNFQHLKHSLTSFVCITG